MDNVQYYHGTKAKGNTREFTVSVVVPSRENLRIDVWKLLGTTIESITLAVGVANVSPKDQYNRKTGRDLSFNRIEEKQFRLLEVVAISGGTMVELVGDEVSLTFLMIPGSDKVRLINSYKR